MAVRLKTQKDIKLGAHRAAGCRGVSIGGAMVSEQHCNFLVNTGNANATDLENLGNLVQKKFKTHRD